MKNRDSKLRGKSANRENSLENDSNVSLILVYRVFQKNGYPVLFLG